MAMIKRANENTIRHVENKDLVSTETIKGKLKQINEIDSEIKRLKELRKSTKDEINDLVLSVDAFDADLEAFVFDAYWNMKDIRVSPLRALIGQRTGDDKNWQRIIAGVAMVLCSKCGQEFQKKYTSRTQYQSDTKSSYARKCKSCEEKEKLENQRQWQARQQEMQGRIIELRDSPYAEYLQTDHWQETRKRALKRARFKCQLCSRNGTLHVHHRTYENLGDESNADLIVLCESCHGKFHDKITEEKE